MMNGILMLFSGFEKIRFYFRLFSFDNRYLYRGGDDR